MKRSTLTSKLIVAVLFLGLVSSASAYTSPAEEKGFWRLNGTCPATDYSGNNYDGGCSGSLTTGATGVEKSSGEWDSGLAYSFDGSDDYFSAGDVVDVDSKSVSAGAWIKMPDSSSHDYIINKQAGSGDDFKGYVLSVLGQNNGEAELKISTASGNACVVSTTQSVDTNQWFHVAGVADTAKSECRVYINGTLKNNATYTSNNISNTAPLAVGARAADGNKYFEGTIDEPRVSIGKAWTESNVSNIYQYNSISGVSNEAPSIKSVEYEVSSSWVSSSSLNFNDQVTRIRANITDPDGDSISDTSLTLKDLYDSNTRISDLTHTSTSGDYFIFDINDQTLDDSGSWEAVVEASDSNGNTGSSTDSWSLSWGTLSATLKKPSSDISVIQDSTFNMTGTASCSGGECSSEGEKVEVWADPVKLEHPVKLTSERGQVLPDEKVSIEGTVTNEGYGKIDNKKVLEELFGFFTGFWGRGPN